MSDRLSGNALALVVLTALCSGIGVAAVKFGLEGETVRWVPFLGGAVVYGASVLSGMWMIGKYSLSIVYPVIVGLSLVVVAAISAVTLGEALTPFKLAGTALIVAGVTVLVHRRDSAT
jgi:multidrug transporter EmrE-like cation transporter